MSIYVLDWIKQDLERSGKRLEEYKLIELKDLLEDYSNRYNR